MDNRMRDEEFPEIDDRYRRADEELHSKIAEMTDVDALLHRVKAGGRITDAALREALASWEADLGAGVRDAGDQRWLSPVDDEETFRLLVGRPRRGVEAWPELSVSRTGEAVSLSVWLPSYAADEVRATAVLWFGPAPVSVELVVSADSDEDGVELVGTVTVIDAAGRPRVGLRVNRAG